MSGSVRLRVVGEGEERHAESVRTHARELLCCDCMKRERHLLQRGRNESAISSQCSSRRPCWCECLVGSSISRCLRRTLPGAVKTRWHAGDALASKRQRPRVGASAASIRDRRAGQPVHSARTIGGLRTNPRRGCAAAVWTASWSEATWSLMPCRNALSLACGWS